MWFYLFIKRLWINTIDTHYVQSESPGSYYKALIHLGCGRGVEFLNCVFKPKLFYVKTHDLCVSLRKWTSTRWRSRTCPLPPRSVCRWRETITSMPWWPISTSSSHAAIKGPVSPPVSDTLLLYWCFQRVQPVPWNVLMLIYTSVEFTTSQKKKLTPHPFGPYVSAGF